MSKPPQPAASEVLRHNLLILVGLPSLKILFIMERNHPVTSQVFLVPPVIEENIRGVLQLTVRMCLGSMNVLEQVLRLVLK